jgi:hypothetical protein
MRTIYTLDIEELDDDIRFNPSGIGYRVTVYEHGEELGDGGVAVELKDAIDEAVGSILYSYEREGKDNE